MKPSETEKRLRAETKGAEWFARMRAHNHTPQDRAGLEAWLAEDVEHLKIYREIQLVWDLLGSFANKPEIKALIQKVKAH